MEGLGLEETEIWLELLTDSPGEPRIFLCTRSSQSHRPVVSDAAQPPRTSGLACVTLCTSYSLAPTAAQYDMSTLTSVTTKY